MDREKLKELYEHYNLQRSDIFTKALGDKSYTIIKRKGIGRIQEQEVQ